MAIRKGASAGGGCASSGERTAGAVDRQGTGDGAGSYRDGAVPYRSGCSKRANVSAGEAYECSGPGGAAWSASSGNRGASAGGLCDSDGQLRTACADTAASGDCGLSRGSG